MADDARLALQKVKINRRRGSLFVYDDRLVISTDAGETTIPLARLDKLATRRTLRGAKLVMLFEGEDVIEVRGLSASDTSVAHRTIVGVARRLR